MTTSFQIPHTTLLPNFLISHSTVQGPSNSGLFYLIIFAWIFVLIIIALCVCCRPSSYKHDFPRTNSVSSSGTNRLTQSDLTEPAPTLNGTFAVNSDLVISTEIHPGRYHFPTSISISPSSSTNTSTQTHISQITPHSSSQFQPSIRYNRVQTVRLSTCDEVDKQRRASATRNLTYVSNPGSNEDDTLCPICLDDISADKVYCALSCGHTGHAKCLKNWISKAPSLSCPMCRMPL